MAAGLGLAAVFNIAEGINLRKVLVSFGYRVSFKEAMKYAYIGYFFSSVTPSATGGQPLQLYAMSKDKIHVAHGTMALLTELTSFQIAAFLMENIAALWILTGRIHLNKIMLILVLVGYIMNLVFIAALMIVIVSDRLKRKIVKGIRFLVMKLPFRHKEKMESKINDILHDFENCKDFFKKDPNLTLQVIGVSLVQIICWFSVPWAVYHAMGEAGSTFGSLFLHQIILYMTTALLPFPGAEGISEFSFVKLFAGMFSSAPVAAVVLVNRGISFYFLLILSGILGVVLTATGNRKWNWKNIDITERIGYDDCTFNEDEESYILFFFRFILCSNAMSSCFFNGYFGRNINCKFNLISLYRKKPGAGITIEPGGYGYRKEYVDVVLYSFICSCSGTECRDDQSGG